MEDINRLKVLSEVIKDTSLCGLGQSSPNPVLSTILNFEDEYLAHVQDGKCPAGRMENARQASVNLYCGMILLKSCVPVVHCVSATVRLAQSPANAALRTLSTKPFVLNAACVSKNVNSMQLP